MAMGAAERGSENSDHLWERRQVSCDVFSVSKVGFIRFDCCKFVGWWGVDVAFKNIYLAFQKAGEVLDTMLTSNACFMVTWHVDSHILK